MVKAFRTLPLLGATALMAAACPQGDDPIDTSNPDTDIVDLVGNVVVEPCNIDFGVIQAGESGIATVRVLNTGAGDLQVEDIATVAPFGTSAAPPLSVQGNGTYQFNVTFEPGAGEFGAFTEDLIVTTDDPQEPSIVCALSGEVTDDADNDGFKSIDAGGDDCDDLRADINPAAAEQWYDGIDQNCDGESDYDQDGDGFDALVHWESSEENNPATGQPGGDCQDVNPQINPAATEVWYDGTDSNCDRQNDFDQDGDGYRSAEYGYEDCNDLDELANPLGVEAFNGADDDCNGLIDDKASPERADVKITGDDDDYYVGRGVGIADLDGGAPEVIVGVHYFNYSVTGATTGDAEGGVSVWFDDGAVATDYAGDADEDVWIEAEGTTDEFGYEIVTMPDFNGGGNADFAATALGYDQWSGRVYVFNGENFSTGSTSATDADLTITGLRKYKLGGGLGTSDVNGDGLSDLVMFGSHLDETKTFMGLHYGASDALGAVTWTEVDATFTGVCGGDAIYTWYTKSCEGQGFSGTAGDAGGTESFLGNGHAHADFDGDGYGDILFGDRYDEEGESKRDQGQAWILFGRRSEYTNSNSNYDDAATKLVSGTKAGSGVGSVAVMSDIDGDGADEVLVHDDDRSTLYLLMGGEDLRTDYRDLEEVSQARFRSVSDFSGAVMMGDWSGDGVSETGLAIAGDDVKGGSFYVIESQEWSGEYRLDNVAFGSIIGDEFNGRFGMGVPVEGGDLNGDGLPDLILGDWQYDDTGETSDGPEGAAFIFYQNSVD